MRNWWRCAWPMRPSCAHGCVRRGAARRAKKERKKRGGGARPIGRGRAGQRTAGAAAARSYCRGVRRALPDDARPPLAASGLKLKGRLEAIADSLERVQQGRTAEAAPAAASGPTEQQERGG